MRLFSRVTFLLGERRADLSGQLDLSGFIDLALTLPNSAAARAIWERALAALDIDAGALANTFRFTPGQARDAVALARGLAGWRTDSSALDEADLRAACRLLASRPLSRMAKKVEPVYGWDDLVLPADSKAQLREICDQARLRHVVHGDWGFERRLSLGRGLSVLFSGPPGTGKTMAAEVIAAELGLDLYKIDLSRVVSKYIGETEKNLDRVFAAAESANAILFFDEADALFGKRSEVKDSHDRYANVEISYLLQKMEEYEGDRHPGHQPAPAPRPGLPAPPRLHRPLPLPRRGQPAPHLGGSLAARDSARRGRRSPAPRGALHAGRRQHQEHRPRRRLPRRRRGRTGAALPRAPRRAPGIPEAGQDGDRG